MREVSGSLNSDHCVCLVRKLPKCFDKNAVIAWVERSPDSFSFVVNAVTINLKIISLTIEDSTQLLERVAFLSIMLLISSALFREAQKMISTSRNMCKLANKAMLRMTFRFCSGGYALTRTRWKACSSFCYWNEMPP